MFSNAMIGFLFAAGFGTWVYTKIQRKTGGNTVNSLVVAGGAALVSFLVILVFLSIFFTG